MPRSRVRTIAFLVAAFWLTPVALYAQTATRTAISGLVTDAQQGILPGASVTLRDQNTNQARQATSDAEGRYAFNNIEPGVYELTVSLDQFKTVVTRDILAEVAKSVRTDVVLEIGSVSEQVVVRASAEIVLQKEDAAVGQTFDNRRVSLLPNSSRDALQLTTLQPGATPSGSIAGALSDQSTFMLDGVDISERAFGNPYETVIPTPADAIEEFRATVANANATFGRSGGGQFVFVTKRGTNQFRGSLYDYYQDGGLNANSWTNKRLSIAKPESRDNRFGFSLGGPIVREKTFFFGLYEGRRRTAATTATRLVPTDSLKQGLLRFRDSSGAIQTIDPRALDPRGLGASPLILEMLRLYPSPNDLTSGDGLNTAGYTLSYPAKKMSDLGILRVDHAFSANWRIDGSLKEYKRDSDTTDQVSLVDGTTAAREPGRPRSISVGLTGVPTPRITNDFRIGLVRDEDDRVRVLPSPQVSGLNVAVDLAGTNLAEPLDIGRAASGQGQTVNVYQFIDNLTWTKTSHTLQAGFNLRHFQTSMYRTNKIIGSITAPIAELGSATFNPIPAAQRPGFVVPADISRYNNLYAALLGQIEAVGYLATRDRALQPLPIGSPLLADANLNAYEFYASDTWRLHSTLTLSAGLMYQWQTPPTDQNGAQALLVYRDSGELIDPQGYVQQKREAAEQGAIFNPDLAWLPIDAASDSIHRTDRNNFSPRISAAWNPAFDQGVLGKLFGNGQTVVRGGYSLIYDRTNMPTLSTAPATTPVFAQVLANNGPRNAAGQPFRAGVDGPIPVPVAPAGDVPFVPTKPFGETFAGGLDPFVKMPYSHTMNATVQRTLPWDMTVEVGYIGRIGRGLLMNMGLNQVPYNFLDRQSGQRFAAAFDAMAAQLRSGTLPANVTPQPWFENLLPNLSPVNGSRTAAVAQAQTANIINGNLNSLFFGLLDTAAAAPFNNRQVQAIRIRTSVGKTDYNALFLSLRKRFSGGLTFDFNYTLSRARDEVGQPQNQSSTLPNSFFPSVEYGLADADRTHVINSNWVLELPFGDGRRFGSSLPGPLKALVSGWYTSGVLRATSGAPLGVAQGTMVWGGDILFGFNTFAIPTAEIDTGLNNGVAGSGGVGTAGNPATGGSGRNLFSDPQAALRSVRPIRLSEDQTTGRGALRGLPFWQVDMSFGKATRLSEAVTLRFTLDLINAFNTVTYNAPTLSMQNPTTFGVITSQLIDEAQAIVPRRIQIGARLEF